jgi:hypothetical protein
LTVPKRIAGDDLPADQMNPTPLLRVEHLIDWQPGTRRARGARLLIHTLDGACDEMTLEPLMTFQMKGIGYGHPVWGHGQWHDERAVGSETYELAALDGLLPENVHVQQLVRARWRGREGLGVFEQVILGPHARYGFRDLVDGAPS